MNESGFDKKKWSKEYYLKNKDIFKARAKAQRDRGYYNENENPNLDIEKRNKRQMEYKKKNNYADEKTKWQRTIRNIKRKTRYHFPLSENERCELCGGIPQCHHHNTSPIEFDKFNILCNQCHKNIHAKLNLIERR